MNVKLFTYHPLSFVIHFPLSLSSLPHYQAVFKYIEKGVLDRDIETYWHFQSVWEDWP